MEIVNDFIEEMLEKGMFSKEKYNQAYESMREEYTIDDYNIIILRSLFLKSLYLACYIMGIPVDRNPIYKDAIDRIQANFEIYWANDPETLHLYKQIIVFMIPRGALKTTICMAVGCWLYLHDAITRRQAPSILLGHGNEDKAEGNLFLCKENFDKEVTRTLFSDVLEYANKKSGSLRFKDQSDIKRKDSHFMTGSPGVDLTGKHVTYMILDDWCTEKNTASPELNKKNKAAFYSLISLDDHSGGANRPTPILIPCTHYVDDSLYCDIKNNNNVLFIRIPVCSKLYVPGQLKESDFNFPEVLGELKLRSYWENLPSYQFRSQYDLIPYPREGGINFTGELPEFFIPSEEDIVMKVVLADPAISKKNKKSQAVVLLVAITKNADVFVLDGIASYGMRPSTQADIIFDYVRNNNAEVAIIEAIHYQEALAQLIEERMVSEKVTFQIKRHRHFISKIEHYRAFLEPLLTMRRIYVNPLLEELILQLKGKSSLDDHIDCLSFLKDLNINKVASSYISEYNKETNKEFRIKKNEKQEFGYFGW